MGVKADALNVILRNLVFNICIMSRRMTCCALGFKTGG